MNAIVARVLLIALCALPVRAQLYQGTLTNYSGAFPPVRLGTSGQHVTFSWSQSDFEHSRGWAYGSAYTDDTDIALATGVTDISQITDASIFTFSDSYVGPVYDAAAAGQNGIGTFVVLRNKFTQDYGVVRFDQIDVSHLDPDYDDLDATWWFRGDGIRDFSGPSVMAPVPEPATTAVAAALVLLGLTAFRYRRNRGESAPVA